MQPAQLYMEAPGAPVQEHTTQNMAEPAERPRVLVFGPLDNDLAQLMRIFIRTGWAVFWWNSLHEAVTALQEDAVPVVFCDLDSSKGSWRALITVAQSLPAPPFVILGSRTADDFLWAQALNAGAYDLLPKPFDTAEVIRAASNARRLWSAERQIRSASPPFSRNSA